MNNYRYVKLNDEQKSFIKKELCKASLLFKKWVKFYKRSEKVSFRHSVLTNKPKVDNIPVNLLPSFLDDVKEILTIKNTVHPILDNRNIEISVIEGYCPLLNEWSGNQDDMRQELIIQCLFCLYYFTDETKNLLSFIRKSLLRARNRCINGNKLIRVPSKHFKLKRAIEKQKLINPSLSIVDICQKLQISERQFKLLEENRVVDKVIESLFDVDGLRHDVPARESECTENRSITEDQINNAPLSDLQRKVLIASLTGKHGWKSKLAKETINSSTNKPYSKMAITVAYDAAIKIMKEELNK